MYIECVLNVSNVYRIYIECILYNLYIYIMLFNLYTVVIDFSMVSRVLVDETIGIIKLVERW